jgi:hypothetical protein
MVARLPTTLEQFRAVPGVGEKECRLYGDDFSAVVRQFVSDHPEATRTPSVALPASPSPRAPAPPQGLRRLRSTVKAAWDLLQQGLSSLSWPPDLGSRLVVRAQNQKALRG